MHKTLLRPALAVGLFLFAAATADAASVDCAEAAHPDEIAICQSRTLSELDVRMATLYGVRMKIPMLMGSHGTAQDEQSEFLVSRDACGASTACLTMACQQRIDVLKQEIDAAMKNYCIKLGICG